MTIKPVCLFLCLAVVSGAVGAEETDPCAGLEGAGLTLCRSNQQTQQQQQRLEQQIQQQRERQDELDKQEREVQRQLEAVRLQNDSLRKQLELESTNQPRHPAADSLKSAELKSWKAENPWYGSDYVKTQFAVHYVKQLQKDRPDLTERELLDALSTKVNETFGVKH